MIVKEISSHEAGSLAWALYMQGYRIISKKFGIASRLDLDPHKGLVQWYIENGSKNMTKMPIESLKDNYRRVHSKDKLEGLPGKVVRLMRKFEKRENL